MDHSIITRLFIYVLVGIGAWAAIASYAGAAVLRHTLLPRDNVFSAQTQGVCATYIRQPHPYWCNPALFSFGNGAAIKSDLALSADQDAYDTTQRILNRAIDKAFVESLFAEKDFQTFSALVRVEAVNQYLSFSYTPFYMVGAYQLTNPNLPEVAALGHRESQFRLTSGMKILEGASWALHGGVSPFLYDRKKYYISSNVLELIVKDVEELVSESRQTGWNADMGFFLGPRSEKSKQEFVEIEEIRDPARDPQGERAEVTLPIFYSWEPSLSLVAENVFTAQDNDVQNIGKTKLLDMEPMQKRRMRTGLGLGTSHRFGHFHLGCQVPFWDFFKRVDGLGTSGAFIYGVGRLRAFASYSALMSAFGFLFMGVNYHVGIQYTHDKQDNSLELKRHSNVYLYTSFGF